ncbi:hypothetical protein D3C72_2476480 [compost metagenome]
MNPEHADSRGHRQFEEVAGANECGRPGHAVRHAQAPVQDIGQARVEVDLQQDRHREYRDYQWLGHDLLALEAE